MAYSSISLIPVLIFVGVKSPKFGFDFRPQSSLSRHSFKMEQHIGNLKQIADDCHMSSLNLMQFRPLNSWQLGCRLQNRLRKTGRKIVWITNNSGMHWLHGTGRVVITAWERPPRATI